MNQVAGFHRRRVGGLVVTAVNDGTIDLPATALKGIAAEEAGALLERSFRAPAIRSSVNTYLVQGRGRTILIDTGAGDSMGPTMGRLLPNLAAAGVAPGDVDMVLLTHLHPDHSGGLATKDGAAVFPNAALAVAEADAAFWLRQDASTMAEGIRPYVLGAQASAAPYRDRMVMLGSEAAPGITVVALPGHTPGHSGFRIADEGAALLIWGDIMHVPDVQSVRPGVGLVFDLDPELAIASRRRILDQVATDRLAVAGMHLHFPGFVHVARAGDGYALVPDAWVAEV